MSGDSGTDGADAPTAGAPNGRLKLTVARLIQRLDEIAKLMRQGHAVYAPDVLDDAVSIIRAAQPFVLDDEAYAKFIAACENPPPPNEKLRELFRKHAPWLEENEKRNAVPVAQRAGA